jgi:hypothetical protein
MFTALSKSVLSVITVTLVSSLAMAQLTPGPGHGGGGGNPPPKYNPCSVPTDPNCHGGGGGGHPGHGGGGLTPGPGHGSNPSYPTYPTYPSQPTYPTYPSPSTSYGSLTRKAINGNLGRCTVRTNVQGRYNQFYIGSNFKGNYENGSYGYNQNNQLENAIRSHYQNGNCDYGSYPSYPNDPSYPSYPDYNNTVLRVQLQRSVYNQSLDLRRLFNLDSNYTGYRVVSVSASTTPNSPAVTIASLVVNGFVMASERNPGYEVYLAPQERVRLDNVGTRVTLDIFGSTYIQELQIELSRN